MLDISKPLSCGRKITLDDRTVVGYLLNLKGCLIFVIGVAV